MNLSALHFWGHRWSLDTPLHILMELLHSPLLPSVYLAILFARMLIVIIFSSKGVGGEHYIRHIVWNLETLWCKTKKFLRRSEAEVKFAKRSELTDQFDNFHTFDGVCRRDKIAKRKQKSWLSQDFVPVTLLICWQFLPCKIGVDPEYR